MLTVSGLTAGYGQSLVLHDVALEVPPGKVVCLIGRNGVGKTTLLRAIMGLLRPRSGRVILDGQDLTSAPPHERARAGLGFVPQGRGIFPYLTVRENLLMGLETGRASVPLDRFGWPGPGGARRVRSPIRRANEVALDTAYQLFPGLAAMAQRPAGRLSGGQQQQLALARAMIGHPRVLLLDEPTEGIQPSVVWEVERAVAAIREGGDVSVLLVEQFVEFAIGVSDAFYVMEKGTIVSQGSSEQLTEHAVREYLAV